MQLLCVLFTKLMQSASYIYISWNDRLLDMSCTPLEKCKHGLGSFTWASCGQGRRDQSVTHGKEWSTRVGWVAPDWKGDEINSYKHAWTIIRRQVSHVCMPPPGRSIENDDHQNPSQPASLSRQGLKLRKIWPNAWMLLSLFTVNVWMPALNFIPLGHMSLALASYLPVLASGRLNFPFIS
jgi:hypothetical protein